MMIAGQFRFEHPNFIRDNPRPGRLQLWQPNSCAMKNFIEYAQTDGLSLLEDRAFDGRDAVRASDKRVTDGT